jgi:hypothetical protein
MIVPQVQQKKLSLGARILGAIGFDFWQITSKNMYDRNVYAEKLRAAGFGAVDVKTVYEDTMLPFSRYSLRQLAKPEVLRQLNPAVASMIWVPANSMVKNPWGLVELDYILAIADKPTSRRE